MDQRTADLTPRELFELGQQWFERQLARCAKAHGVRWPDHEQWVRDFLLEELRQRYEAHGWRRSKR